MTTLLHESIDLHDAERNLHGHVRDTPVIRAHDAFVKLEHLQITRSFKERGALNAMIARPRASLARGVLTASAGNHAQGLAYHAQRLGIAASVVMPTTTPQVKIDRVRACGATVHLHGNRFIDAHDYARALAATSAMTFVHPYDDPDVIAGQATATLAFLDAVPDLDVLVVPVGGGGLIAGAALAIRHRGARVRLVGVRHAAYPTLFEPPDEHAPYVSTLADGLAVAQIGVLPRAILAGSLDDVVVVSEAEIGRAIAVLACEQSVVAEGAGAAGFAALEALRAQYPGRRIGTFVTGGNIERASLAACLT